MWDTSPELQVVWYVLAAASVAVFLFGVGRPIARWRRGRHASFPPIRELPSRTWAATKDLYAHAAIKRRDASVGWAHRGIFYGWVVLAIGTVIVLVDHDITGPIFGVHFFHGDFYLGYKAALNAFGAALIAGVLVMMLRRAVLRPRKLDYTRPDRAAGEPAFDRRVYRIGDWVFVVALLVIAVTGYLLEGARLAMDEPGYELFQFGGAAVAVTLDGLGDGTLSTIRHATWWFHGLLAITFVAAIPYTKAFHMLSSYASTILADPDAGRRLRGVPDGERAGYHTLADFSSLHLLQLDACTKCGKCHEVCPATQTAQPLSPRDVVLELREEARHGDDNHRPGGVFGLLGRSNFDPAEPAVVGPDRVREETIWACYQCNACVEICPVGIEQGPMINELRRDLVEDGRLEPGLQATLDVIHKSGNSFGERRRRRGRWTAQLDFPVKDAREEPVDVLWFVGDYASFDPRSQGISRKLAELLTAAEVDFGILYDAERNAGNDVRRVGEEGLFELLAGHNIGALEGCEFARIVTTDPHSLNTLRNEYPDLGGEWTVLHHTALLQELLEQGRLRADPIDRRVTYHDPCYLGRMNGGYDPPRRILEEIGCELVEMPRNRDNSLCCGAGGGRIWTKDEPGCERPSESRIHEAVGLEGVECFVVSCPKDVTMYEDAIKVSGNADRLFLREITELVHEATSGTRTTEPSIAVGSGGSR